LLFDLGQRTLRGAGTPLLEKILQYTQQLSNTRHTMIRWLHLCAVQYYHWVNTTVPTWSLP